MTVVLRPHRRRIAVLGVLGQHLAAALRGRAERQAPRGRDRRADQGEPVAVELDRQTGEGRPDQGADRQRGADRREAGRGMAGEDAGRPDAVGGDDEA